MLKTKSRKQEAANSEIMPPAFFWAKVVPNSELEFALYAKNVAWLLQGKLVDARDLLARMYGHKDAAEVIELLKSTDGQKGPFLDTPPVDADFGTDRYLEWRKSTERRTHGELREHLYTRERIHKPGEYDDELRYSLVNEIGLFCTPKVHQNLFKRVKALIASESRISTLGFPIGYNLSMQYHFGADYKENKGAYPIFNRKADKALKQFITEDCPHSQKEMLEFAMERKAAGMLRMTMKSMEEEIADEIDCVPKELIGLAKSHLEWGGWERTLDLNFADEVIAEFLLDEDDEEVQDEEEAETESNRNLALFLLNPCKDTARKCGVLKDYPDLVNSLPKWRFAVLYALAGEIERAYAEDGEDTFEIVETYARLSGNHMDLSSPWLRLTGILNKRPGWEDLNRWDFTMQVSLQDKETEVMEPVGRVSGCFLNVLDEDGYKDDADLESALKDDDVLLQAWEHVRRHYRDRLGFSGMHEWVNMGEAHSFALLRLYISEKFTGVIDERHMLDLLDDAFGDGAEFPEFSAVQMVLGDSDYDSDWFNELENRKAPFCQLGAVVLHVPGTGDLALSIFETEVGDSELPNKKCTKFLRRRGEVLSTHWRTWDGKALNDTDRLMGVVDKSTANVIVFDPLPWKRKDRDDCDN